MRLIVGCFLLDLTALDVAAHKDAIGNEHSTKELILGRDPLQAVLEILVIVPTLLGVLDIATFASKLVVDGRVSLLKHLALFVTCHLLMPSEVDRVDIERDDLRHARLYHLHAHHIRFRDKRVFQAPRGSSAQI